jgi:hypothetical protein
MRVALAVLSAVLVLAGAAAPHHHAGAQGGHGCVACVARGGEPACDATPDMAPAQLPALEIGLQPGLPPVAGAPWARHRVLFR